MMDNLAALKLLCEILSFNTSTDAVCGKINQLSHQDWEKIYVVATKQKVTLNLYESIQKFGDHAKIPDFAKARLRETYHRSLAINLRMLHHAKSVLEALRSQNIDVIALKGIYLAEAIYNNIGLRTFFDLDFMVRKEDIPRTLSFMMEMGYITTTYYNPVEVNLDIKHIPAMKKGDGPYIEIHWGILEEDEPFNIDLHGIWQRAGKTNICGVDVLALGYEDLILHLCVHFTFQHSMDIGLGFLYDIALVIHNHHQDIDWNKLVIISERWEVERIIWLTLSMLRRILNVDIPNHVLASLLPENTHPSIVDLALNHFMEKANTEERVHVTPDLLHLSSNQGLHRKIKLILERIFISKQILARAYNITPNSPRIYLFYFVRFGELFSIYSPSLIKIVRKNKVAVDTVKSEKLRRWLIEWCTDHAK